MSENVGFAIAGAIIGGALYIGWQLGTIADRLCKHERTKDEHGFTICKDCHKLLGGD